MTKRVRICLNVAMKIATKKDCAQNVCQVFVRNLTNNSVMQIIEKYQSIKIAKWSEEAKLFGWTLFEKIDFKKGQYVHDACGKKQIAWICHMRKGRVDCSHCWNEKLKSEALIHDWFWLKHVDASHSIYKHNKCGFDQILKMGNMRKGTISCSHCKHEKWKNEAKVQGWTWVKKITTQKSIFIHDFCGHEQIVGMGNMRGGRVACHVCNESWYKKPSNTYLLKINIPDVITFLKFGISKDVNIRAKQYGLPSRANITIICAVAYKTGKKAIEHEKQIHKTIVKNKNVIRYDASPYMDVGHTECYKYSKEAEKALLDAMLEANSNS